MQNQRKKSSKELLLIKGDGSRRAVVQSLLEKRSCEYSTKKNFKTFKVNRSPLFNQLQDFLPKFEKSTNEILLQPEHERNKLDVENVDGCENVVEMNILIAKESINNSDEEESNEDEICTNIISANNRNRTKSKKKSNSIKQGKPISLITEIEEKNISDASKEAEDKNNYKLSIIKDSKKVDHVL